MHHAQRFRTQEGGYHPPVSAGLKMSYLELLNRFWQLEAEQPFSPAESKFYFYWLNAFNEGNGSSDRWPALLRRFTKQVAADLLMDEKTIYKLIAALGQRGLLRYTAGTRTQSATWHLAYGKLLDSHDDRNNSSRQTPRTSRDGRNNSSRNGNNEARTSRDDRNYSSPLYKEDKTSSVVEEKTETVPAADASAAVEKKIEWVNSPQEVATPVEANAQASHTKGGAAPTLTFPAWATDTFRTEWAEWLAFRQAKRDKLKPASLQRMLDKLAAFDEGFCSLLFDKALTNGYTGLLFDDTPAKYEIYKRNQSTPFDPTHGNPQRNGYAGGHKAESLAELGAAVDSYFESKYGS